MSALKVSINLKYRSHKNAFVKDDFDSSNKSHTLQSSSQPSSKYCHLTVLALVSPLLYKSAVPTAPNSVSRLLKRIEAADFEWKSEKTNKFNVNFSLPSDKLDLKASFAREQDMADRVLVEVQGENGAYYKAFVTDVLEDEIQLAFEKSWQPESKFPFARVRLPPNPAAQPQFEQEQEVEVRLMNSDDLLFTTQIWVTIMCTQNVSSYVWWEESKQTKLEALINLVSRLLLRL